MRRVFTKEIQEDHKIKDLLKWFLFLFFTITFPSLGLKFLSSYFPGAIHFSSTLIILSSLLSCFIIFDRFIKFQDKNISEKLASWKKLMEIGKVCGQVMHDLQAPMAGWGVIIHSLKNENLSPEDRDIVSNLAQRASLRMKSIIEDLLFQMDGKIEEDKKLDVNALLNEVIQDFKGMPQASDVVIKNSLSQGSLFVSGQQKRLERIFINIVKNALEAMKLKGTLEARSSLKNNLAVIELADSGPGIPKEKIEEILKGNAASNKSKGYGIGLKFVKEVIERHKGKMEIDSALGQGTTFRFQFPIHVEDRDLQEVLKVEQRIHQTQAESVLAYTTSNTEEDSSPQVHKEVLH